MATISEGYYLVITIVLLLDAVTGLGFGHGHFGNKQSKVADELGFQAKMFEQKLDHFNPNDNRTWAQRYYFNSYLSNYSHEIAFIKIGGTEQANLNEVYSEGAFYHYATKFNAILFSLEHRYYGLSYPTDDLSNENLQYLSSQQALADLKHFVEFMTQHFNLTSDVKWVAFGQDYGGSLAVWARQQYPDLIYAAVSSSAPLLATIEFNEYLQLLPDVFGPTNKQCPDLLKESFRQLEELLDDPEKYTQLNGLFNLCTNLQSSIDEPLDISTLFYNLIFYIEVMSSTGAIFSPDTLCSKLTDESIGSVLKRLSAAIGELGGACVDIKFDALVKQFNSNDDTPEIQEPRLWLYQQCSEFGFFHTTTHEPYYFGHHLDVNFYVALCQAVFFPAFNRTYVENGIAATNALHHGLDINVTNTIFIQGSLDPWYPLGITKTRSEDAPAIFIEGGFHSSDMSEPSDDDPLPVKQARAKVEEYLTKWLKN